MTSARCCSQYSASPWGHSSAAARSSTLQEPQIERREHQDNSDIYYQSLPEVVPEEQDVHADHDGYQREHIKHDGCLSSHRLVLLRVPQRGKSGAGGLPGFHEDHGVFRTLARHHRGLIGVWCDVLTGGTLSVGEEAIVGARRPAEGGAHPNRASDFLT